MSFLKDFSPKRTRKSEPQRSNPEVRSGPVQEIKREIPEDTKQKLVEEYAYKPDKSDKPEKEKPVAQKEQFAIKEQIALKEQKKKIQSPIFGFFELYLKCEERLLTFMYGKQDPDLEKIYRLKKQFIYKKMELIAEYKKDIEFDSFKDILWYYKGEIIIPEEYKDLTGFLREYFNIEQVIVLYDTGEMLLEETAWCNFWFKERLQKFSSGLRELSHTEIIDDLNCLKCGYNYNCPFARFQQMVK